MPKKPQNPKQVEYLRDKDASRMNLPSAEHESVAPDQVREAVKVVYNRRNPDLDPQLVWRGKDVLDWSDLVVQAPPIYIQEKVHPKALIDDLLRQSQGGGAEEEQMSLFSDFNGLPEGAERTDFYQHEGNWQNRMILGDSLQVMASLAEREGLRGKVQCIYIDPPYGIKFNSNFQWSTTSRDVKDGKPDHITREPEMVKAFRDTWRDGIHSYLTYLRDRLTVARDLLTDSGSIFVQIGDENVHRVRAVLDEVFGDENFVAEIFFKKTGYATAELIPSITDTIIWYARKRASVKYRQLYEEKEVGLGIGERYDQVELPTGESRRIQKEEFLRPGLLPLGSKVWGPGPLTSSGFRQFTSVPFNFQGKTFDPGREQNWKTTLDGLRRLIATSRVLPSRSTLTYKRYIADFPVVSRANIWSDTMAAADGPATYVVRTAQRVIERCLLMATDPGDLVIDPTCGSGTTATVAEQWGRRWITIDTSRVALALARARIMGARYPSYLLADSPEGQQMEAKVTQTPAKTTPTYGRLRQGFVYERVPHITLKSIANNAEIDVIWERWEQELALLRQELTQQMPPAWLAAHRQKQKYTAEVPAEIAEWEVPRERPADWPDALQPLLDRFWAARIARQKEIDASIAAKADFEYLYDKPYQDKKRVRVAGPFTVESLSPHRTLPLDENDELFDPEAGPGPESLERKGFAEMILEALRTHGVQQSDKKDRIQFTSLAHWPGHYLCAQACYEQDGKELRAGIFIGPEFGTVVRRDLVDAAKEAGDAGFDLVIACAFSYDAHSEEFSKLGRVPLLKARMNADLHMGGELKNTGKGNLFVIFGEPDIEVLTEEDGRLRVQIHGVDVFDPRTGEIRSDNTDGIACWFVDTDYNGESFFVRHAYFLGASDPYKSLKTTLKAEIDEDAWSTLHSDISRPFDRPSGGRIAVKVINHLGDEVMKVYSV